MLDETETVCFVFYWTKTTISGICNVWWEKKMVKYEVSWKTTWARDRYELATLEEAIEYAKMKKGLGYKEVKLNKVEYTEIEF